jgi:molecular chaperone Hsp33
MKEKDSIQRFIFEDNDVRGECVSVDDTLSAIFSKQQYPTCIKTLLAEAVLSATLMASTIKFKGQLTLQFKSAKSLSLLLVKCSESYQIRALAQFDEKATSEELLHSLDGGVIVVTVQADNKTKPYQSIVPFRLSIAESLEFYFAQSEQLPSRFWFAVSETKASGMLLQLLPAGTDSEAREFFWEHANKLAETIRDEELLSLDNQTFLYRLYHEEKIRLFDSKPIGFFCPCSRNKMLEAVRTLGEEEAIEHFKAHKSINVTCEFCQQHYAFDKVDVSYLFHRQ